MNTILRKTCYKAAQDLKQQGLIIKRAHIYEVIAAVLGYSSYAALTVEEADIQFEYHLIDAEFLVLNKLKGEERAKNLDVSASAVSICIEALKVTLEVPVFESVDDFYDEHGREALQTFIYDSVEVSSQMAESNASFIDYPDMHEDFITNSDLWTSPKEWSIEDSGTLSGEYDPDGDRMFNGDTLHVWGRLTYGKAGRAGLIFLPESSYASAMADDTWGDVDESNV